MATERCLQPHLHHRTPYATFAEPCEKGSEIDLEDLGETRRNWVMSESRASIRREPGVAAETSSIFFPSAVNSVRLEFFGEELDKLRVDPATQRSLDPVEQLRLTPTGLGPDRRCPAGVDAGWVETPSANRPLNSCWRAEPSRGCDG